MHGCNSCARACINACILLLIWHATWCASIGATKHNSSQLIWHACILLLIWHATKHNSTQLTPTQHTAIKNALRHTPSWGMPAQQGATNQGATNSHVAGFLSPGQQGHGHAHILGAGASAGSGDWRLYVLRRISSAAAAAAAEDPGQWVGWGDGWGKGLELSCPLVAHPWLRRCVGGA